MSFTDVNEHTKKIISSKQYKCMGKFSVTTPDRSTLDLEKTFSLEGSGSVLNPEKKDKGDDKSSFAKEIENFKKINRIKQDESNKASIQNIPAIKVESSNITENLEKTEIVNIPAISSESAQLINALVNTQNYIVGELTEVFDKRLEKFDDIIVDLIRCKTENERLKQKVDNLTRDNYKLKKEVESFKSVVPGLYIKRELDKTKF